MGKDSKKTYPVFKNSPLGEFLSKLQAKLSQIRESRPVTADDPVEKAYSDRQLVAIGQGFDFLVNMVLPIFDAGKVPGLFNTALPGMISSGLGLKSLLPTFHTPQYAVYEAIEKDLGTILTTCLDDNQIKSFTVENIGVFRHALKVEIRKQKEIRFAAVNKIPNARLDLIIDKLDVFIDKLEFKPKIDRKALLQQLSKDIKVELVGWDNQLKDFNPPFQLKITDAGLYELIIEFLLLIDTFPESLDACIPFLNPTALNLNFKSGLIAKLLSAAGLEPFQLLNTSSEGNSSAYCYDLSIGTETTSFNGNDYYREGLPQSRVFLYGLLKQYFASYGETLHVKGERAKAKLIQEFITKETEWLESKIKPYQEKYEDMKKNLPAEMAYGDQLDLLKQKMAAANELLHDIEQLIAGVSGRNYQQNFADLLVLHNMTGALEADAALALDVTYAASVLPTTLIAEDQDRNFTVIPVQQTLQTKLFSTLNDLSRLQKQIEDRKLAFAQQNELILQEWRGAEIRRHQRENELWLERIEHFRLDASEAFCLDEVATLDDSGHFELQIQSLNKQLEHLAQYQEKLKRYETQLEVLQEQLRESVSCPQRLCQDDNAIREEVGHCYAASKEKMSFCVQQLHENARLFESRREILEGQLRKVQAAKAFAETMRSSNPEDIEILLDDKQDQLQESTAVHEKLIQGVSKKRLQLQQDEERPYLDTEVLEEGDPLLPLLKKRDSIIHSILTEIAVRSKQILAVEPGLEAYFDGQKLISSAGVDAAQYCLNRIFEKERALEHVEDNQDYPQMLAALSAAYNCINDSKEAFPFKRLASLPALQGIVAGKNSGFEALLNLLDDSSTTKVWLAYSKSAPQKDILLQAKSLLLELIEAKRWSYQSKIQAFSLLEKVKKEFLQAQDSLRLISGLMIPLPILNNDIDELMKKRREQKRCDLLLAIEQEELTLVKVEEAAIALTQDVSILKQIVDLLRGCQELNKLVAEVEALDTEFGSADLLYQNQYIINRRIEKAATQQGKLKLLLAKLAGDISNVNNNTAYLANIETITSLLNSAEQRILKFQEDILSRKINDLQVRVQTNQEAMAAIGKKLVVQESIEQEISWDLQLSQLNTLLMRYSSFADARTLIAERRGLVEDDLQALKAENLKAQFSLVSHNVQQLALSNERLLASYLNRVDAILKTYEKELQTHSATINVEFDETTERYEANQRIFVDTENYLKQFPQTVFEDSMIALDRLKPASEAVLGKLKAVCQASETLHRLLTQKQAIHAALNERIEVRKNFAVDFSRTLDRYIIQRNGKYALKDYVLSTDKVARQKFVDQVKLELNTYAESGNSESLFTYINAEKEKFAGYKLKTILSQLLHGLTEQDRKIPKNHGGNKLDILIVEHQRALAALATFEAAGNNKEEFVRTIKQLYVEIEGIEQYGEKLGGLTDKEGNAVLGLAFALRAKVDTFIISNQGQEVTQQALASFQTGFMYLAHTQDELMSKHASWWKPVLVNMVAAVTTLGIVVGLQLAASKWSTGRFAFFYDRSVGLERVDAVEKAAAAIVATTA